MSLLQAQGQPQADRYPLWFLFLQGDIVRRRVNRDIKTQAIMFKLAHGANKSKDISKIFKEELEKLDG